ncbi:MAG: ORC1-type DNA replication protein [Candidatus Asgardarchaeia archaeon]
MVGSVSKPLDDIFEQFLSSPKIIKNRDVLRPTYVPEHLPHRDDQIRKIAMILAAALKGGTPSNLLLYGKTGTGKTAVAKYVLKHLKLKSVDSGITPPLIAYINCGIVDTNYRVLAQLNKAIGVEVPFTGLPTDEVYHRFLDALDKHSKLMIIVLDEVDMLVKKSGDSILYDLTRINSSLDNARVSIIGISNDLKFKEYLDPRVLSSLSEEEIVFPPYTANELKDILKERAALGIYENAITPGVINLCAAYAAREHGDARRALDLLRVSAEIAEREGADKITEDHVRKAKVQIEADVVTETIKGLPLQSKLVLYAIYAANKQASPAVMTGDVYSIYTDICKILHVEPLTQRRVSDLINELDMLGVVNASVVSKGRYGRSKRIKLAVSRKLIRTILEEDPRFQKVSNYFNPEASE